MAITTTFTLVDDISNKIGNIINKVNNLNGSMNSFNGVSKISSDVNNGTHQLKKFTNASNHSFDNLESKISNVITSLTELYIAYKGLKALFNFSDKVMNIDARVNLLTNGEEEAQNLKSNIRNVSKHLGADFTEFADQVIKIKSLTGETFKSNNEALRFTELLSKSFRVAGTSAQESSSAIYQLTQALGSGALQGDEFRSIRENAPMLVDAIAKTMNVSKGELKKLGAEGKITADIIKTAIFSSADEIEGKFAKMPQTWGQLYNVIKTQFTEISENFFKVFNTIAGNTVIRGIINDIMVFTGVFLTGLGKVLNIVLKVIEVLEPFKYLLYGIVGAFVAYHGIVSLTNGVIKVHDFLVKGVKRALATWTIIQKILNGELTIMNALLNLNPIGLLIGAVVVFIGILQTAISVFNKYTGSTKTLLGVIVGTVYATFSIISNIVIGVINMLIKGVNHIVSVGAIISESIYNLFVSPLDAVKNYVISVINFVLGGIKKLVAIADKVTGKNMAGSIGSLQDSLEGKKTYTNKMVNWSSHTPKIKEFGYYNIANAWKNGNSLGDKWQKGIGDILGGNSSTDKILGDLDNKLGNIDKNTEKGANSTSEFVEDLKLLRDMANRDYIAKVTAPSISIEINNDNHINTEEDKEDFIKTLTDKLSFAIGSTAMKGVVG